MKEQRVRSLWMEPFRTVGVGAGCRAAGWCIVVGLFPACTWFERPPAADTPEAAARTAYLLCDGCHGPPDIRMETMSPRIGGQKRGYLIAKLKDYRSGTRSHPWMDGVTRDLSDQDITQLATYYSARRANVR